MGMTRAQWRLLIENGLNLHVQQDRSANINAWPTVEMGPGSIELINGLHRKAALTSFINKTDGWSLDRDGYWAADVYLLEDLAAIPVVASFLSLSTADPILADVDGEVWVHLNRCMTREVMDMTGSCRAEWVTMQLPGVSNPVRFASVIGSPAKESIDLLTTTVYGRELFPLRRWATAMTSTYMPEVCP